MKASPLKATRGRKGSALLIILAFVLLLAIITTAFLSRAMLDKTVSTASSDQTRTDIFASGAIDAILSDFQQEIAAGSTGTTTSGTTIYMPVTAQDIVPSRTWTGTITQPNPVPNLIKRSACALKFYPTGDPVNYPNASSYPPNEQTFTSADSNDSTATASLNGRSYSSVRWNQALLLPKATLSSSTDYTPTGSFTPPDWILVQRDGTNPTVFSSTLTVPRPGDVTTINKNPVVGRYAYTVYDEGGLLDANVVGFPSRAYPNTTFTQKFYRTSLASVDLLQLLPSVGGSPFFTQSNIDSLVGWRNFATLQLPSGSTIPYPATLFPITYAQNYFLNVSQPNTGFLHPTVSIFPTAVTSITNGQTDRKFASRQQLMNLLLNDIAQNTTEKANLQNALQYLGTFSRGLSQPSYTPDANRPRMAVSSTTVALAGGGTVTDLASTGGNAAQTDDSQNLINIPFPTTLVQTSFTRNDGSTANVGEPLVKKRFALNRLAWLTYAGPIADDSGNYNTAAGISTIVSTLKTQYGYTDAFLKQGGPTNIQNYFGLKWAQDGNDDNTTKRSKWFYNVHNGGGTGMGKIQELGNSMTRDPDFFELIKATILAGSKGKALTTLAGTNQYLKTTSADLNYPYNYQNNIDVSFDYQVLQIGANIIDQSRLDGYTTEIIFDNSTNPAIPNPYEIRGVENYPYLYRLRAGCLKIRNENNTVPDDATKTATDSQGTYTPTGTAPAKFFTDTGIAALMQIPEIWNPHDYYSPMGGVTGAAFPTQFRLVADSTTPYQSNLVLGMSGSNGAVGAAYSTININGVDGTANSPLNNPSSSIVTPVAATQITYNLGPPSNKGGLVSGGYSGQNLQLYPGDTALTFTVPSTASTLYREPTVLARPNVPAGSNLATAWSSPFQDWTTVRNAENQLCYVPGSGFLSDIANPMSFKAPAVAESSAPTTQAYLGIMLGFYPVQWIPNATTNLATNYIYYSEFATFNPSPANYGITYRMQYLDPIQGGWVTYDQKYVMPRAGWVITPTASATGNLFPSASSGFGQSAAWQTFADPRTSRFGAPGGDNDNPSYLASPGTFPYKNSPDYLDGSAATYAVLASDRPDYNQGFSFESFRISYNTSGVPTGTFNLAGAFAPGFSWANGGTYSMYRWGPISQNTVSTGTAQGTARFNGDTATSSGAFQPFYYSDADGVVRRAMGGLVPNSSAAPASLFGYPMTTATQGFNYQGGSTAIPSGQSASRPYLLKRPFRTVGELGYVFSGTPWKNLDFSNPESGDSALLDVFCINDTDDPNGLVAGRVNLNTQQVPVLAAVLAEANYYDVSDAWLNFTSSANGAWIGSTASGSGDPGYSHGTASAFTGAPFYLANWLVSGPESTLGTLGTGGTSVTPLMNVRELVGKYTASSAPAAGTMGIDGTLTSNYGGFSNDISSFYNPTGSMASSYAYGYDTRFREAAMRALSQVGETRVWNLMIDVVAQTGRFPATATNASNFLVEGERRYWVHVAIDRYTGKILDRQIEEVRQ